MGRWSGIAGANMQTGSQRSMAICVFLKLPTMKMISALGLTVVCSMMDKFLLMMLTWMHIAEVLLKKVIIIIIIIIIINGGAQLFLLVFCMVRLVLL
jgi:hypothetical protein